jgi:hypothetical protein
LPRILSLNAVAVEVGPLGLVGADSRRLYGASNKHPPRLQFSSRSQKRAVGKVVEKVVEKVANEAKRITVARWNEF